MSLTILSVAYSLAPVGPDVAGGAEQVLSMLDRGFRERGHQSVVVALDGSKVAGQLVPTPKPHGVLSAPGGERAAMHRDAVKRAIREYRPDIVHYHGLDFRACLAEEPIPSLVTMHLAHTTYDPRSFRNLPSHVRVNCVSEHQTRHTPWFAALTGWIANGIPLDQYAPPVRRHGFAFCLGRICPEKGFDLAIQACRAAGVRLLIAGQVFPYRDHLDYFDRCLQPLLGKDARLIGPADRQVKRRILAAARCLVVASRVEETSSLVAMEALASGTPVAAFRRGALPEMIQDGVTGHLADDVAGLSKAILASSAIDPVACRQDAERRFSSVRMCESYLDLYRTMLRGRPARVRASSTSPIACETLRTQKELEDILGEWTALHSEDPAATPFQSPAWLLPWWKHLGRGRICALAMRSAGRLSAFFPLFIQDQTIRFLGGESSDYEGPLIRPDLRAEAWKVFRREICREDWRVLDLFDFPSWAPEPYGQPSSLCPVLPLDTGWRPSASLTKRLHQARNHLTRRGELRFSIAGHVDLDPHLTAWLRLHASRWNSKGEKGVLSGEPMEKFHREAARGLLSSGHLALHGLRCGERWIGAAYCLQDARRTYYYLGGFDPDYARFSPGSLLIEAAIRHAAGRSCREFDFLRGQEAYKYRWGAVDRQSRRWMESRASFEQSAAAAALACT